MSYFFRKDIKSASFQETIDTVTKALSAQGFGVLTSIDMQAALKKKLDIDFRKYTILGACNPLFAYEALQQEEEIGLLLPCNVVVQETADGDVSVSIIDPIVTMSTVDNPELERFARQVKNQLMQVLNHLK